MTITYSTITLFLLHSYIVGWLLIAWNAMEYPYIVDLCDVIRKFILAPIITTIIWLVSGLLIVFFKPVVVALAIIICSCVFFGLLGYYVFKPIAMKTYYNVIEPISDKFCIVLYRKNKSRW